MDAEWRGACDQPRRGRGWDDPEPLLPGKKRRGRKSKKPPKGRKWKLSALLKHFPTETITVSIYGKIKKLKVVTRDLWITGVESRKVRIVVVKTKGQPVIFVSTDLMLTPVQIIEIYARRFMGETVIRDLKQHFGIGDYQCTGPAILIMAFRQVIAVYFNLLFLQIFLKM